MNLDDIGEIKKLDTKDVMGSIAQLPDQVEQAWDESREVHVPREYDDIKAIVCAGMGGSAYGARLVKSLYSQAELMTVPLELVSDYHLPGYIDEKTLVILASYSGTTEEVLSCAHEAESNGAKIMGLTSGGQLAEILQSGNYPSYIFYPSHNPCGQPRVGQGYMQIGLIGMLSKIGRIPVGQEEITQTISFLRNEGKLLEISSPSENNKAKQLAKGLVGKIPVIIVADFLEGAAHAIRNPFHETAKQFGLYFVVPELNHHLLEGLKYPKANKKLLGFIIIHSDMYDERNKKRIQLTKEVIEKNGLSTEMITLKGTTQLMQSMELIQLGSFVSGYLGLLNGEDPSKIPWVDYFKMQLKK